MYNMNLALLFNVTVTWACANLELFQYDFVKKIIFSKVMVRMTTIE